MKKIVVRVPQWLGDAVVSTVFLRELKKMEAPCEISVICPTGLAVLFESDLNVSHVIPLAYSRGGNVLDVGQELRKYSFDKIFVLPRSFRTALEAFLSKIPLKIGFGSGLGSVVFDGAKKYDHNLMYANRYLKLIDVKLLSDPKLKPFFPKTPLNRDHSLVDQLEKLSPPILGIAPCSVAAARTWFPSYFRAVAEKFLAETQGSVVFFGSQKEHRVIEAIRASLSRPTINTAGMLSLPELGWVMDRCHVFLGNDSGLMHVASAFEVPSVIIFGPSRPEWALLRYSGESVAIQNKDVFCVPCEKNDCVRVGEGKYECLATVSVENVFAEIKNRIGKIR